MISSRSATDYRSGLGDHGYSRETQRPAEIQKLLVEFRNLYHERLRRIDQSDDSREEALQSKVGVLQSFVQDLSEQNEVRIQALEAEEAEGRAVEGRTTSLHKELERRLSLALCPMPVDLAGTTATFFRTPSQSEEGRTAPAGMERRGREAASEGMCVGSPPHSLQYPGLQHVNSAQPSRPHLSAATTRTRTRRKPGGIHVV